MYSLNTLTTESDRKGEILTDYEIIIVSGLLKLNVPWEVTS